MQANVGLRLSDFPKTKSQDEPNVDLKFICLDFKYSYHNISSNYILIHPLCTVSLALRITGVLLKVIPAALGQQQGTSWTKHGPVLHRTLLLA